MRDEDTQNGQQNDAPTPPARSDAAQRALAEAAERRRNAATSGAPQEIGGRGGLDPARYGDWEIKGLISDF
jgi:hypothetical protein